VTHQTANKGLVSTGPFIRRRKQTTLRQHHAIFLATLDGTTDQLFRLRILIGPRFEFDEPSISL
jgi:hypothetical protein